MEFSCRCHLTTGAIASLALLLVTDGLLPVSVLCPSSPPRSRTLIGRCLRVCDVREGVSDRGRRGARRLWKTVSCLLLQYSNCGEPHLDAVDRVASVASVPSCG